MSIERGVNSSTLGNQLREVDTLRSHTSVHFGVRTAEGS